MQIRLILMLVAGASVAMAGCGGDDKGPNPMQPPAEVLNLTAEDEYIVRFAAQKDADLDSRIDDHDNRITRLESRVTNSQPETSPPGNSSSGQSLGSTTGFSAWDEKAIYTTDEKTGQRVFTGRVERTLINAPNPLAGSGGSVPQTPPQDPPAPGPSAPPTVAAAPGVSTPPGVVDPKLWSALWLHDKERAAREQEKKEFREELLRELRDNETSRYHGASFDRHTEDRVYRANKEEELRRRGYDVQWLDHGKHARAQAKLVPKERENLFYNSYRSVLDQATGTMYIDHSRHTPALFKF